MAPAKNTASRPPGDSGELRDPETVPFAALLAADSSPDQEVSPALDSRSEAAAVAVDNTPRLTPSRADAGMLGDSFIQNAAEPGEQALPLPLSLPGSSADQPLANPNASSKVSSAVAPGSLGPALPPELGAVLDGQVRGAAAAQGVPPSALGNSIMPAVQGNDGEGSAEGQALAAKSTTLSSVSLLEQGQVRSGQGSTNSAAPASSTVSNPAAAASSGGSGPESGGLVAAAIEQVKPVKTSLRPQQGLNQDSSNPRPATPSTTESKAAVLRATADQAFSFDVDVPTPEATAMPDALPEELMGLQTPRQSASVLEGGLGMGLGPVALSSIGGGALSSVGVAATANPMSPSLNLQDPTWTAQLGQELVQLRQSGENTLKVSLAPEHLGQMELELLQLADGSLELRMQTENSQARDLLLAQSGELRERFQGQGMTLSHFSCTTEDHGEGLQRQENGEHVVAGEEPPQTEDEELTPKASSHSLATNGVHLYA